MIDLVLDASDDLAVVGGDFVLGECTLQNQRLLVLTEKGDWKSDPSLGVGAMSFLENDHAQDLARAISKEFAKDGMRVQRVVVLPDGKIQSNAEYI